MWRNEGNGHKFRTNRFWQALRDYLLFGFPIVCAFLNMKLSKPNDNRPIWKFKHKLVEHTMTNAPQFGFRKRRTVGAVQPGKKQRCPQTNKYKCELGRKSSRASRLKAAEYCERIVGRRMVSLVDHFHVSRKQLRCARCGDKTGWGCLSCGVALCLAASTSEANRLPVCCMDVAHMRWKYDLNTGAVVRH